MKHRGDARQRFSKAALALSGQWDHRRTLCGTLRLFRSPCSPEAPRGLPRFTTLKNKHLCLRKARNPLQSGLTVNDRVTYGLVNSNLGYFYHHTMKSGGRERLNVTRSQQVPFRMCSDLPSSWGEGVVPLPMPTSTNKCLQETSSQRGVYSWQTEQEQTEHNLFIESGWHL